MIPTLLVATGLVLELARRPQPPQPREVRDIVPYAPPAPPAPMPVTATEVPPPATFETTFEPSTGPSTELVFELRQLAHDHEPAERQSSVNIDAIGTCVRPSNRAKLHARVLAWLDHEHPGERSSDFALRVGCLDADGLIADFTVDRSKGPSFRRSRWGVVRITDDGITSLAERLGTAKQDWMEWADEGTLSVAALVDLDGDGARDAVIASTEHEGGNLVSEVELTAIERRHTLPIAHVRANVTSWIHADRVALQFDDGRDPAAIVRCIASDLTLVACPAAQREADRAAVLEGYRAMTIVSLPDRDLLREQLALLGISAPAMLELAEPTRPNQHAKRAVERFVAKARGDTLESFSIDPHATAQQYFGAIRSQLGDSACTRTTLDAATLARITAWVHTRTHDPAPDQLEITGDCGAYAWARWDEMAAPTGDVGLRHEALLLMGDTIRVVTTFEIGAMADPQSRGSAHAGSFFWHGAALVGELLELAGPVHHVLAISNGEIVAKRKGDFELYSFDARWNDVADDLVREPATHAWWHATPTGLEKIDPEAMRGHEARRAALELLATYDPIDDPRPTTAFVRALEVLGADRALAREVAAL